MEHPSNFIFDLPKKLKVTRVNGMVKIDKFGVFSLTLSRVFNQSSSKGYNVHNHHKNVRFRNLEFLTQSLFSWGQTQKKMKKSEKCYFFANLLHLTLIIVMPKCNHFISSIGFRKY